MVDELISTQPESTSVNALKIPVLNYTFGSTSVKIPYAAIVDLHTYGIILTNSAVGSNKNHLTLWNGSSRKIRIRKIDASANITGNITGSTIMLTVQALSTQAPTGGTNLRSPETVRPYSTSLDTVDPLPSTVEVRAAPTTGVTVVSNWHLTTPKPLHIEEAVTTVGDYVVLYDKTNELSTIQLDQNQGLTVQQGTLAGAGNINLGIYFTRD